MKKSIFIIKVRCFETRLSYAYIGKTYYIIVDPNNEYRCSNWYDTYAQARAAFRNGGDIYSHTGIYNPKTGLAKWNATLCQKV